MPDGHGGTQSATRRMLVKFAAGPGTETFVEELRQPCLAPNFKSRPQDRFFTTGSKRTVAAGEEASFTLVVVPHDPGQDAKNIAEAIRFNEPQDGIEIEFHYPTAAVPVRVALFRDGRWEISRRP